MKTNFEFEGVMYKYIAPDNFTYRQFLIGKQLLGKLLPILQKSEALAGAEIDMTKMMEMYSVIQEMEEIINEVEIFHLLFIPEDQKKFNLEYYKIHKNDFDNMEIELINELRGSLADFFTYMFQHIADGILTSMNQGANPMTEPDTLSIVEKTE